MHINFQELTGLLRYHTWYQFLAQYKVISFLSTSSYFNRSKDSVCIKTFISGMPILDTLPTAIRTLLSLLTCIRDKVIIFIRLMLRAFSPSFYEGARLLL